MPAIRNSKRERFCLYIAEGMKVGLAAEKAGFAFPGVAGSKMLAKPEIKARVAELDKLLDLEKVKEHVRGMAPTRDYVLKGLIDNVESAKNANDRASVNKGLELVGKEIGMFVQRNMQIDSPLQRLPADKLLLLLQLVDNAVGTTEQIASTTLPRGTAPPLIEATAEPTTEPADDQW